jgi:putative membrane protein
MSEHAPTPPDPQATGTAAGGPHVPRTRTGGAYKSLLGGAVVLALLLIFILENTRSVKISYLGESGHMALGVALLLAAVAGALLVGVVGSVRILQLRRRVKRRGKDAKSPVT